MHCIQPKKGRGESVKSKVQCRIIDVILSLAHNPPYVLLRAVYGGNFGKLVLETCASLAFV